MSRIESKYPALDRSGLVMHALSSRENRAFIERDRVDPDSAPEGLGEAELRIVAHAASRLRAARAAGRSRMLTFGAHTIKNGLGPVLMRLMEEGWLTHLATNGAGIIHDWEFAYCGESSEHVADNVAVGRFGAWEETGRFINLALAVGAYEGRGYGESIGALIENEGLTIPLIDDARAAGVEWAAGQPDRAAAALDLVDVLRAAGDIEAGFLAVPHPFKRYSVQAAAYRLGISFTSHPMIGHDIIYVHPLNRGSVVGRTAERDFLRFAEGVSKLEGGIYLSVGSAVMSPMIFEKSMSMAQNLARQGGDALKDFCITVVDLAESRWDWSQGEPPEDNPDYYLRYNKTFSRMGGELRYVSADNRAFLLALYGALKMQPEG